MPNALLIVISFNYILEMPMANKGKDKHSSIHPILVVLILVVGGILAYLITTSLLNNAIKKAEAESARADAISESLAPHHE